MPAPPDPRRDGTPAPNRGPDQIAYMAASGASLPGHVDPDRHAAATALLAELSRCLPWSALDDSELAVIAEMLGGGE